MKRLLIRADEMNLTSDCESAVQKLFSDIDIGEYKVEGYTVFNSPWAFLTVEDEHCENVCNILRDVGFLVDDADAEVSIPENQKAEPPDDQEPDQNEDSEVTK